MKKNTTNSRKPVKKAKNKLPIIDEIVNELMKDSETQISYEQPISPQIMICGLIDGKEQVTPFPIMIDSPQHKELTRELLLKSLILLQKDGIELTGYVIRFDCKVTIMNIKTKKAQVKDCVTIIKYTKNNKETNLLYYDKGKIIKRENLKQKHVKGDNWDYYRLSKFTDEDKEMILAYDRFKEQNPNLYRDII